MTLDPERRAERQRRLAHRREAARYAGVAWSGLGPEPFQPRSDAALAQAAQARLATLQAWRESPAGLLTAAMAEAERAVEIIRACVARGLDRDAGRCRRALDDLQSAVDAGRAAA